MKQFVEKAVTFFGTGQGDEVGFFQQAPEVEFNFMTKNRVTGNKKAKDIKGQINCCKVIQFNINCIIVQNDLIFIQFKGILNALRLFPCKKFKA